MTEIREQVQYRYVPTVHFWVRLTNLSKRLLTDKICVLKISIQ
jgi:hypothetical protein